MKQSRRPIPSRRGMKAMVMAAGAGTRLRPLTFSVPKPMVPIANRPVLEYTLLNLKRSGITDIVLNLHSYPQMIRDYFGNGHRWGVRIQYSYEPELLGTAGGVKKVEAFLQKGTFLVMSGDGLTDVNLSRVLAFHAQHRASATMVLKAIDTRLEYGVTLMNPQQEITRFIEKPLWSDVFSNQVNTGIYVFEPSVLGEIPEHQVHDFGNQVWPTLLQKKERIFGYVMPEYWCDVGNLHEYRRAQRDVLEGKVGIKLSGRQIRRGIWVEEGTVLERGVTLKAPCLIGRGGRIARGATLGPYTVIGDRARIGSGAKLQNCTLWNDVRVTHQVSLDNCIIGHGACVRESISVYEGAVINISSAAAQT